MDQISMVMKQMIDISEDELQGFLSQSSTRRSGSNVDGSSGVYSTL